MVIWCCSNISINCNHKLHATKTKCGNVLSQRPIPQVLVTYSKARLTIDTRSPERRSSLQFFSTWPRPFNINHTKKDYIIACLPKRLRWQLCYQKWGHLMRQANPTGESVFTHQYLLWMCIKLYAHICIIPVNDSWKSWAQNLDCDDANDKDTLWNLDEFIQQSESFHSRLVLSRKRCRSINERSIRGPMALLTLTQQWTHRYKLRSCISLHWDSNIANSRIHPIGKLTLLRLMIAL